jgi:hypothetical protein
MTQIEQVQGGFQLVGYETFSAENLKENVNRILKNEDMESIKYRLSEEPHAYLLVLANYEEVGGYGSVGIYLNINDEDEVEYVLFVEEEGYVEPENTFSVGEEEEAVLALKETMLEQTPLFRKHIEESA